MVTFIDMNISRCKVCASAVELTRSWLVELESSSGNGLETPSATQLAKMANRMKISNGLTDTLRKHVLTSDAS